MVAHCGFYDGWLGLLFNWVIAVDDPELSLDEDGVDALNDLDGIFGQVGSWLGSLGNYSALRARRQG